MRITVTLDPDVEALIRRHMTEHWLSFHDALNSAIRNGLPDARPKPFTTPTHPMGKPTAVSLDHALRLADDLNNAEIYQKPNAGAQMCRCQG